MQASRRGSFAAYPQDPEPRFPEGSGPPGTCFTASGQRPFRLSAVPAGPGPAPNSCTPAWSAGKIREDPGPPSMRSTIASSALPEASIVPETSSPPRGAAAARRRRPREARRGPGRLICLTGTARPCPRCPAMGSWAPWPRKTGPRGPAPRSRRAVSGVCGPLAPKDRSQSSLRATGPVTRRPIRRDDRAPEPNSAAAAAAAAAVIAAAGGAAAGTRDGHMAIA